jgi:hypothetical protein
VPAGQPCSSYNGACSQCVDVALHPLSPNCRFCGTSCIDGAACSNAINVGPSGTCPTPAPPTPAPTLAPVAPTPSPTPTAGSPCADYDQCVECVALTGGACDWCALGSSAFGQCRARDSCAAPYSSAVRNASTCPASIPAELPAPTGSACASRAACERFCRTLSIVTCECSALDRFFVRCADGSEQMAFAAGNVNATRPAEKFVVQPPKSAATSDRASLSWTTLALLLAVASAGT